MQLRLCQLKATGEIYYYLGEVVTSKGILSVYEKPTASGQPQPHVVQMHKLQFQVAFTLLAYGSDKL